MGGGARSHWRYPALVATMSMFAVAGALYHWWLPSERNRTLLPAPECDLHQAPCEAGGADSGRISLSITPRPVPVLDALQLTVTLHDIEAETVEVWFTGVDVDMGLLRYPLSEAGNGVFRGPAWLSVCSRRQMTWQAQVRVEGAEGLILAPFRFDTVYRRGFTLLE